MTSKERWIALLRGEIPDRIPTDYWGTDEVTGMLCRLFNCSSVIEMYRKLNIDGVVRIDAPHKYGRHPDDGHADIWGLRRKKIDYGAGVYDEFDNHPLAEFTTVDQIKNYKWPKAKDHDFETYKFLLKKAPDDFLIRSGDYEPFLLYCALRGMEQALLDFLLYPEILDAALTEIFNYYYELNARTFEAGKGIIGITYLAEDLGSQTGLLFSRKDMLEHIFPRQKLMADMARSFGLPVFYHTDGDVFEIIPDLLEITGIQILNPIQWRCPSMDRKKLAESFGDKVIFHGAVDNQFTLPFGTADDVKNEVLENIAVFSSSRWICAPCHNIQPITPLENIIAMYRTINDYGKYYK